MLLLHAIWILSMVCYHSSAILLLLQVKYWLTHNEPFETCWSAYGLGEDAPGYKDHPGTYPYICTHNIIKSHAAVWHLYDTQFRSSQTGTCFYIITYMVILLVVIFLFICPLIYYITIQIANVTLYCILNLYKDLYCTLNC